MSNFFSALGQGLTNFGHARQERQQYDQQVGIEQERYNRQLQDKDRSYAWEVAQNLAPDQELDDVSWAALQKGGPELGAYVQQDPLTGKRKWRGTQQQQTSAAREQAQIEAARRSNELVAKQQEELTRRDAATAALKDFAAKNGRHPTRDELFKIMTESGTMDPKQLGDWHLENARIDASEAQSKRALAMADRYSRMPVGPQPRPAAAPLDINQLRNETRKRLAQGMLDPEEYSFVNEQLRKMEGLQRGPLQFYMNDLSNDLTGRYQELNPNKPAQWGNEEGNPIRNPQFAQQYLEYTQSNPEWQSMAAGDGLTPEDIQRYQAFVKQMQEKWQGEEMQRQQERQQKGGWMSWLPGR
jgi:hypothetical protein